MSKHTPGPWEYQNKDGTGIEIRAKLPFGPLQHYKVDGHELYSFMRLPSLDDVSIRMTKDGELWAHIAYEEWVQFEDDRWREMQQANGKLITAAPDLLEACKKIVKRFKGANGRRLDYLAYRGCLAAVAKAEEE